MISMSFPHFEIFEVMKTLLLQLQSCSYHCVLNLCSYFFANYFVMDFYLFSFAAKNPLEIDAAHVVGKNLGEDLVFGSRASGGGQQS